MVFKVISIRKRINYPKYYSVHSLCRQRNVEFTWYFFAVKGKGIRLTHLAHAENALDYAHSSVQHLDSHGMVCKHLLSLPMTTFLLYLLLGNMFFFVLRIVFVYALRSLLPTIHLLA
jgi:hypothetical protein